MSTGSRARRAARALREALSFSADLLAVVPGGLAIALVVHLLHAPVALGLAAGAVTTVVLGGLAVLFPLRRTGQRLLYGYRFTKLELVHTIDGDDPRDHQHDVHIDLKVVRSGLRLIPYRYWFSGRHHPEVESRQPHRPRLRKGARRLLGPEQENQWWLYWIVLGGALSAGTRRSIHVHHDLHDAERTFQPHVTKTVLEPIDRLVIRVRLPQGLWPVSASGVQGVPDSEQRRALTVHRDDAARELVLDVRAPAIGRKYGIEWHPEAPGDADDAELARQLAG